MYLISRRTINNAEYNSYMEQFKPDFIPPTNCLICWESIKSKEWAKCYTCNIYLHSRCEKIYRDDKGYCKCPHCQDIGTLGSPKFN